MDEGQSFVDSLKSKAREAVLNFAREYRQFRADELHDYVERETGLTFVCNTDGLMRDLREDGEIKYRILGGRGALYEVDWIKGDKEE